MAIELTGVAADAFDETGDAMLVLGGPGSGKTTLSLLKAKRLVEGLGPGQRILFLSFSRAAVRQVLTRCKDLLSRLDREHIVVKTYHSFCIDLLRAHGRLLTGRQPRLYFPGAERIDRAAFKGDREAWEAERTRLAAEESLYAFDLFARSCADLLARSQSVRQHLTDIYPIIIVDEFQDTDDDQWALVQQLSRGSRLIVLADQDQRIFEYDDRIDPRRLDLLREALELAEYDLGGENHRSPDAGILQFADAVLHNRTLPDTDDVKVVTYQSWGFDATVHAAVVQMFRKLRTDRLTNPTIAVLCRANGFVADISTLLMNTHTYGNATLGPIDHDVVWDEDQAAAAAQVVASILEWPARSTTDGPARTLAAVARYFEMKNAIRPSATSSDKVARFDKAAAAWAEGQVPRIKAAKELIAAAAQGVQLAGDPRRDWFTARDVLLGVKDLVEIHTSVRFVRLFRASDEIGGRLSELWTADGAYTNATEVVRQTLEVSRVLAEQRDHQGCTLMTMHKSKGKEFDGVVIVEGAWRGKFFDEREGPPHAASRRLLRVAITRARHRVLIVRPHDAVPLVV